MPSTDPFSAFLDRESFRTQVAGNSAKLAFNSAEVSSSGWGEVDIEECIVFDSVFTERPTVGYGYSVDEDALIDGQYPRAIGFVRDWKLDKNGFWRGAWVSLCVDMGRLEPVGGGYDLIHSFVFSGIALTAIREDLTADSDPVPNALLQVTPSS